MYNINDILLYGSYGVCRIIDIAEKDFCGQSGLYYIMEPVFSDQCTFFVATDNQTAVGRLRQVLSAVQVRALIKAMPATEEQWNDNPKLRKLRYGEIIAHGDRQELIGMIKALHNHRLRQQSSGKKLNMSDEQSLKLAEKMLYDEIALVLRILPDQVVPYIASQLEGVVS